MPVVRNNLFYHRDSYHGQVEHALINIHSHTSSSLRVRGPASTISCHQFIFLLAVISKHESKMFIYKNLALPCIEAKKAKGTFSKRASGH